MSGAEGHGDELLPRALGFDAPRAPTPGLRSLLGETTTLTTETPPWLPPDAYPFRITWWPLALLGHDEVIDHDAPLYVIEVTRPGTVEVPTKSRWTGDVCICVVYADGATEWVGP